jgi:hypothetical protein
MFVVNPKTTSLFCSSNLTRFALKFFDVPSDKTNAKSVCWTRSEWTSTVNNSDFFSLRQMCCFDIQKVYVKRSRKKVLIIAAVCNDLFSIISLWQALSRLSFRCLLRTALSVQQFTSRSRFKYVLFIIFCAPQKPTRICAHDKWEKDFLLMKLIIINFKLILRRNMEYCSQKRHFIVFLQLLLDIPHNINDIALHIALI